MVHIFILLIAFTISSLAAADDKNESSYFDAFVKNINVLATATQNLVEEVVKIGGPICLDKNHVIDVAGHISKHGRLLTDSEASILLQSMEKSVPFLYKLAGTKGAIPAAFGFGKAVLHILNGKVMEAGKSSISSLVSYGGGTYGSLICAPIIPPFGAFGCSIIGAYVGGEVIEFANNNFGNIFYNTTSTA